MQLSESLEAVSLMQVDSLSLSQCECACMCMSMHAGVHASACVHVEQGQTEGQPQR